MAAVSKYSRQRLDFADAKGGTTATLTVTLADGTVHRFDGTATKKDARRLAAKWTKDGKAPASTVRQLAAAKALNQGALGMALVAKQGGPLKPVAVAMGKVLGVTSRLSEADVAAGMNAGKQARALVTRAQSEAKLLTGADRTKSETLLRVANDKRKAAKRVEKKSRPRSKKKKTRRS